jgi:hypothetical protein
MLYHLPTIGRLEAELIQPEAGAMEVKRANFQFAKVGIRLSGATGTAIGGGSVRSVPALAALAVGHFWWLDPDAAMPRGLRDRPHLERRRAVRGPRDPLRPGALRNGEPENERRGLHR